MKKQGKRYVVYSIGKSGRKIIHDSYEDAGLAREHQAKLRKLYGKYIRTGVADQDEVSLDGAVKKCLKLLKGRSCQSS